MTRAEKRRFVRDLTRNVTREILANVPRMPEHWDGHELRRYIADRFDDASMTLKPPVRERRIFGDRIDRRRYRDYRNDVLTLNL